MNTDRPLDGVTSIKLKLGVLVGASVLAGVLVAAIGDGAGVPWWTSLPVTAGAAVAVTQWLARGMTSPLREMTGGARRMARATTASASRRARRTRWASWRARSTRWPRTSRAPTSSGGGSWPPSPTSCARR